MQSISGEKACMHVSMQKVVTLNTQSSNVLMPDIAFATHHNRFFSEPPMQTHGRLFSEPPTFAGVQHTFIQMKKLCILQGGAVTFSGQYVGQGVTVTVCYFLRERITHLK